MAPLSPELQATIANFQKVGRALDLWHVGCFCIFGWDCLICLRKEMKYIWRKHFTLISFLYVVNRYLGLFQGAMGLWIMETKNSGPAAQLCKKIFLWQPVGTAVLTVTSHALMAGRVYALFGLSKIILGVLIIIMAAEFVVQVYSSSLLSPASPPVPGIPIPCIVDGPVSWLIAYWALPLLFDTVTFGLTLFKTVMFWREEVHTPTITLLFRDGLAYFAVIFTMNVINLVLFVTQDVGLRAINLPATLMLNIIMSCRLVLNIRKQHSSSAIQMSRPYTLSAREEEQRMSAFRADKPRRINYELDVSPTSTGINFVTRTSSHV